MTDIYRSPTPPEPSDLEEEEEQEEQEEDMPEPPDFPTFWIALILLSIEGSLYYFKPEMGMLVLSGAFNVVLYALFRIKIAYTLSQEYEARMKQLQAESKDRKTKDELAETKYMRAAFTVVVAIARKEGVPVERLLQNHVTAIAQDELGPAATHMRSKSFG